MDFGELPEHVAFREQVRDWLVQNLPDGWGPHSYRGPKTGSAHLSLAKQWQRQLYDGGWAGLSWPKEYGGRDAGTMEQIIWGEEYARAWAPNLISISVGQSLTGPLLIDRGEPWQRERFLKKILTGEEVWCQGFSEPNAGSDLASLQARGEVTDSEIIVTGQKIWTSFAQYADWCILIVRTDSDVSRKHDGLTFVLLDMTTPGIEIRPLVEITGENWFNEVFFDRVRIPIENVVGGIGKGWGVVVHTLSHERASSAPHAKLEAELDLLIQLARRTPYRGGTAGDDPTVRQQLARFSIEVMNLKINAYRNAATLERTGHPGPAGSLQKLGWSELDQRIKSFAVGMLGPHGLLLGEDEHAIDAGYWSHELLWSRAATIYAGTSEIQRNIIAERVLKLPRA
ncbi:MAG: acyl-CoA dehydrogenase family protein [Myxococcota bacterium]